MGDDAPENAESVEGREPAYVTRFLIDPPAYFTDSADAWVSFLRRMRQLPQELPEVQMSIDDALRALKARNVLPLEETGEG